jgi:hypothetical protein
VNLVAAEGRGYFHSLFLLIPVDDS